ncbi:MAG: hypothetical protein JNL67_07660 [Planctomycetaceae bacterium]|nr:hypothetical protein [Planctomycetaceae bacterium]
MQHLLETARRNFGPPGTRKFSWLDKMFYLHIPTPSWCDSNDDLFAVFQNQQQLLENGVVVWAHIIQANCLLFEPGKANCPASVVFSPDTTLNLKPSGLGKVAQALFRLKGTAPSQADLKEFADNLTDETTRTFGLKVPSSISPRVDLYEASTFVTRKHLPTRILSLPFFPLLVAPKPPYYNIPLPSKYWPSQLVDSWHQASA